VPESIVAEDTTEGLSLRLEGTRRVYIQVAGKDDLADLMARLQALPGVLAVEKGEDRGLEIHTRADVDLRPQVARTVLDAGYDLLELRAVTLSLEDIFLHLIQREEDEAESLADEASARAETAAAEISSPDQEQEAA